MIMEKATSDEIPVEVVHATTKGRMWAAGLIILGLIVAAAYQFWAFPMLQSGLAIVPPPAGLLLRLKLVFAGFSTVLTFAGIAVGAYGQRIRRAGQFPLPHAWVLRDTPVKRGPTVTQIAWMHIVTGGLIALLSVGLSAYVWIVVDRFAMSYTPPPGVTIQQQFVIPGEK